MPIFELQDAQGKNYELDAPDMQTAAGAFMKAQGGGQQAPPLDNPHPKFNSPLEGAMYPITNAPNVYLDKVHEAQGMMSAGMDKIANGSIGTKALGVGQAALGAMGYVTSPISAAIKTTFGNPVELNTGVPADLADLPLEMMVPGMGMTKGPNLARGVPANFVSPASAPSKMADITGAFERSNVNPSLPAVTENRGVGVVAKSVGDTIVGNPVARGTEEQFRQAGAQANAIADTASPVADAATAGERIQAGAERFRTVEAPARQDDLYGRARDLIDPQTSGRPSPVSPLTSTEAAITRVEGRIGDPGVRELVTDKNFVKLSDTIREAAQRGGLTFDDLRELRTQVRNLRPAEGSAVGINKGAVDNVYKGLTDDMMTLAEGSGGPEGALALKRADQYTRALEATRAPTMQKIIDGKSGEDVFAQVTRMAGSNNAADWRKLAQIRSTVSTQDWNDLTATVIRGLGESTAGAKTVGGSNFSPAGFLTNYSKLSERGKGLLFGTQTEMRTALDDLAKVSGSLKKVEKLGNPSGSGRYAQAMGAVGGMAYAPIPTIAALGTGNVAARILSSPKVVRWLVGLEKARKAQSPVAFDMQKQRIPVVAAGDSQIMDALKNLLQGRPAEPAYADGKDQSNPVGQ